MKADGSKDTETPLEEAGQSQENINRVMEQGQHLKQTKGTASSSLSRPAVAVSSSGPSTIIQQVGMPLPPRQKENTAIEDIQSDMATMKGHFIRPPDQVCKLKDIPMEFSIGKNTENTKENLTNEVSPS
ncbi:unnamed protein product [Linum trigynum]|uniref:Uncharacterized protein n=1 Tax=Linum trigynum TaxID=586398 RepID=A0AAV2E456_9ROSI